jgi:hypothetical protein
MRAPRHTVCLCTSSSTSPSRSARFRFSSSSTLTLSRSRNGAGSYRVGSIKSGGFCYRMPCLCRWTCWKTGVINQARRRSQRQGFQQRKSGLCHPRKLSVPREGLLLSVLVDLRLTSAPRQKATFPHSQRSTRRANRHPCFSGHLQCRLYIRVQQTGLTRSSKAKGCCRLAHTHSQI